MYICNNLEQLLNDFNFCTVSFEVCGIALSWRMSGIFLLINAGCWILSFSFTLSSCRCDDLTLSEKLIVDYTGHEPPDSNCCLLGMNVSFRHFTWRLKIIKPMSIAMRIVISDQLLINGYNSFQKWIIVIT